MKKNVYHVCALALISALSACSGEEPANNVIEEVANSAETDLNAAMTDNGSEIQSENAVIPTAPDKPNESASGTKPAVVKPAPPEPKAAETKPAENTASAPECAPEHRAAGHC